MMKEKKRKSDQVTKAKVTHSPTFDILGTNIYAHPHTHAHTHTHNEIGEHPFNMNSLKMNKRILFPGNGGVVVGWYNRKVHTTATAFGPMAATLAMLPERADLEYISIYTWYIPKRQAKPASKLTQLQSPEEHKKWSHEGVWVWVVYALLVFFRHSDVAHASNPTCTSHPT